MRIRSSWFGVLLVVGGAFYLLSEFHVVHFPAGIWSGAALWPLALVVVGLSGFWRRGGGVSWWSFGLFAFGIFLFLRNSGLAQQLQTVSTGGVFWAFVFICIGMSVFMPRRFGGCRRPRIHVNVNGKHHNLTWEEAIGDVSSWKPKHGGSRHWIGDVSLGSQAWVLDDMSVWNGIGDVRMNLATAHLEDRTYKLEVEGWIGDIRILVPSSIPVCVKAEVGLGDITVFENAQSGTSRQVYHEDPAFATSDRRIMLNLRLKIGDIQVVRV